MIAADGYAAMNHLTVGDSSMMCGNLHCLTY